MASPEGIPKGVMIVVEEQKSNPIDNRILFVREGVTKAWKRKGQLSVPSGIIDNDQGGTTTAARELKEETNLLLPSNQFSLMGNFRMNITGTGIKGTQVALADVFKVEISNVQDYITRVVDDKEILETLWLTREEIRNLSIGDIRPGNIEALQIAGGAHSSPNVHIHNGYYQI